MKEFQEPPFRIILITHERGEYAIQQKKPIDNLRDLAPSVVAQLPQPETFSVLYRFPISSNEGGTEKVKKDDFLAPCGIALLTSFLVM